MTETLAAGELLAEFRIRAPLGGGQGGVYLADDTRLGRQVALRLLADSDPARLRLAAAEANAAGSIDHPSIGQVFGLRQEGGRAFLVLEYVQGRTLVFRIRKGIVPVGEMLDAAVQLAEALAEAHSEGMIHTHVRPVNILTVGRGRIKLLDLGQATAKRMNAVESDGFPAGVTLATAPYLSPEQAAGQPADARGDVFSAGAVLYEMVAGRRPFPGKTTAEIVGHVAQCAPDRVRRRNPAVPNELDAIIHKCLARDPAERYGSAVELAEDLRGFMATHGSNPRRRRLVLYAAAGVLALAAAGGSVWFTLLEPARITSLAVLPFSNESAGGGTDHLVSGIAEQLTTDLGHFPSLRVVPRSSSLRVQSNSASPAQAGKQLKAQAVLAGRLGQRGDTVAIQLDLIESAGGRAVWSRRFERKAGDLVALEREMTEALASELRIDSSPEQWDRLWRRYPRNAQAFDWYLRGRHAAAAGTLSGVRTAIECFEKAVASDPSFALAHASLADNYLHPVFPPAEARAKAAPAALKAWQLDEGLAESHATLAKVRFALEWNWDDAEREFRQSILINPNYVEAYRGYAEYQAAAGKFTGARESIQEALRRETFSPLTLYTDARTLLYERRYDQAIDQSRKLLDMSPGFAPIQWPLTAAYLLRGQPAQAIAAIAKANILSSETILAGEILAALGCAYAAGRHPDGVRQMLQELENLSQRRYVSPYNFAVIHACQGDREAAFRWLEKAYQERSPHLPFLAVDPMVNSIRGDRRFRSLLERIGLVSGSTTVFPATPRAVPIR